jgi:phage tail sheath protein FI
MSFPTSPGVYTSEIDTTGGIPAVSVSTGAIVGTFNWGPVNIITEITSGVDLNNKFGDPDSNGASSFFTAWNFLQYSSDLKVVRCLGSGAKNATANGGGTIIMNETDYFNNVYPGTANNSWAARYPGHLGSSLEVITFSNTSSWSTIAGNIADPLYTFANQFAFAPNTSPYVAKVTNNSVTGDEVHVLVVDALGLITGQANTVLERWPSLSRLVDSLSPTGVSNYYKEFIYQNSKFVFSTGIPAANVSAGWNITIAAANGVNMANGAESRANVAFLSGGLDGTVTAANVVASQALFSDPTTADISLFMCADGGQTVTNGAIAIGEQRKDIVVFGSPPLANTQDPSSPATAINNYVNGLSRSTYAFLDTGWKYQFDQFNNVYRWVPLNGDIAGLAARTDNTNDPWWSFAGLRRGQILNTIKLAYNPSLADRNSLYQNGVNPVVTFPGEGTMLYGDKTFINYASVFSRVNVRRLFIVLEKSISKASRAELFEFNDAFTQAQFVNIVTPFLRQVQGRRGIQKFKVVCDSTNNTPAVVNANQFVGDIYIIPPQSINYIQLNFIAVDNGVNFNYIVGQVA